MRHYRARMQILQGRNPPRVLRYAFEAGNITEAQKMAENLEVRKSREMHVDLENILLSYFDDTQYFMTTKLEA